VRLDVRVQITLVILHHDVEVLTVLFDCRKGPKHSHGELSFEHRNYLHLSILVLGVLEYLFDGDNLTSSDYFGLKYLPKSTLPDQAQILNVSFSKFHGGAVKCFSFCFVHFENFLNTLVLD